MWKSINQTDVVLLNPSLIPTFQNCLESFLWPFLGHSSSSILSIWRSVHSCFRCSIFDLNVHLMWIRWYEICIISLWFWFNDNHKYILIQVFHFSFYTILLSNSYPICADVGKCKQFMNDIYLLQFFFCHTNISYHQFWIIINVLFVLDSFPLH